MKKGNALTDNNALS